MDDLLLCDPPFPTGELERCDSVPMASAQRFDGATIRKNPLGVACVLVGTRARHVVVAAVGRYNPWTSALVLLGALPRAAYRTLIVQDEVSGQLSQRPFSRWQVLFAWMPWFILRWLADTIAVWAIIAYSYLWLAPQLLMLRRRDARQEDKGRLS